MHEYDFTYVSSNQTATLDIGSVSGGLTSNPDELSASVSSELGTDPINALAIRAKAGDTDIATLLPTIKIDFGDASPITLGALLGDADAEYFMIIDGLLANGFTISGQADLQDGSGSNPMYGFKVGYSTVPLPGAAFLFVPGLGLFAWLKRRLNSEP